MSSVTFVLLSLTGCKTEVASSSQDGVRNSTQMVVSAPVPETDIAGLGKPSVNGSVLTFTASAEYSSYQWWLDGELQTGATNMSWTLDTQKLSRGMHHVMLIVTKDSRSYSANYMLEVLP